jgi:hypothetical protein
MLYDTKLYNGYIIEIEDDGDPIDPREDDNLGEMICFHSRLILGDKHSYTVDSFKEQINLNDYISLPLYLYDHSGITMKTTPFNDNWDSGQVGYIMVSKYEVKKEYGWKSLTSKRIKQIEKRLCNEVKIYDDYISGNVYSFTVKRVGDEWIGSCGGFFGTNFEENGLLEYARNEIDGCIEEEHNNIMNEGVQTELNLAV